VQKGDYNSLKQTIGLNNSMRNWKNVFEVVKGAQKGGKKGSSSRSRSRSSRSSRRK